MAASWTACLAPSCLAGDAEIPPKLTADYASGARKHSIILLASLNAADCCEGTKTQLIYSALDTNATVGFARERSGCSSDEQLSSTRICRFVLLLPIYPYF